MSANVLPVYQIKEYCYEWTFEELFQALNYIDILSSPTTFVSSNNWIKFSLELTQGGTDGSVLTIAIAKNDELQVALGDCDISFSSNECVIVSSKRRISSLPGWKFALRLGSPEKIGHITGTITCHLFLGENVSENSPENPSLHLKKLSRDLNRLFTTGSYSDLSLRAGGTLFRTHKAILSARAPELASLLNLESEGGGSNPTKEVDTIQSPVLEALLSYWYSGEIDVSRTELPTSLGYAIETLKLDDLKRKICIYPNRSAVTSRIQTESHDFTWPIGHLDDLLTGEVILTSPILHTSRFSDIQLNLMIQKSRDSDDNELVDLFVHRLPGHALVESSLHFKTAIVNVFREFTREKQFTADSLTEWNLVLTIRRSELENDRDTLLPDGTLSLYFKVTLRKISHDVDQCGYTTQAMEDHRVTCKDLNELSTCMSRLYTSKYFSDFTLRAGNQQFPIHKAILSTRVPELFNIFQNSSSIGSRYMSISGIDPAVLNKLLSYIYSGKIDILDCGTATKLYLAAYKYDLYLLKDECLSFIRTNTKF